MKTFRAIVKEAFVNTVRKAEKPDDYPAVLATELREILRLNGYAIHAADGRCVRIPPSGMDLGRPMTEGEMRAAGILPAENGTAGEPESPPAAEGDHGSGDPGSTGDRTVSVATAEGVHDA